jgi:hypothetical protein
MALSSLLFQGFEPAIYDLISYVSVAFGAVVKKKPAEVNIYSTVAGDISRAPSSPSFSSLEAS